MGVEFPSVTQGAPDAPTTPIWPAVAEELHKGTLSDGTSALCAHTHTTQARLKVHHQHAGIRRSGNLPSSSTPNSVGTRAYTISAQAGMGMGCHRVTVVPTLRFARIRSAGARKLLVRTTAPPQQGEGQEGGWSSRCCVGSRSVGDQASSRPVEASPLALPSPAQGNRTRTRKPRGRPGTPRR